MSLVAATPLGLVRPRAILFDWDNTLVDSWATIHEALNVVMAAMEKPSWSLQETKERVRLSLRESFPIHFGARWEEAREIYLDAFRAIHLDRLNSLPGRSELLRALFRRGTADRSAREQSANRFVADYIRGKKLLLRRSARSNSLRPGQRRSADRDEIARNASR